MLFEKIKVFYGQLASEKTVNENLVKKICEIMSYELRIQLLVTSY